MRRIRDRQPEWKDLFPDVRVRFAPVGRIAYREAKAAAARAMAKAAAAGLPPADVEIAGGEAMSLSLIASGIMEWEGVGDADGQIVAPTPDRYEMDEAGNTAIDDEGEPIVAERGTISLFLDDPRHFEACDAAYVMPFALEHAEGNAYAGSPAGTSVEATPADAIASSVAPTGGDSAASGAPIAKKPRAQKRVRRSGK